MNNALKEFKRKHLKNIVTILIILLLVKLLAIEMILQMIDSGIISKPIGYPFPYPQETSTLMGVLSYRWDSVWFTKIAVDGYPDRADAGEYAFAPLYPVLIRGLSILTNDYIISSFLVTNAFYFLTVVAFYFTANIYFKRKNSLYASLLFGLFPIFFTFGLISYSEPIYLFFAILSYYFFAKKDYLKSGVLLGIAALGRYNGVFVCFIYLFILLLRGELIKKENKKLKLVKNYSVLWLFLPIVYLMLLSCISGLKSGNFEVILDSRKPWGTNLENPISQFISFMNVKLGSNPFELLLERYIFTIPMLLLSIYLRKINRWLSFYGIISMLFVLSITGITAASTHRYILMAWPVFLVFGKIRDTEVVAVFATIFSIASLVVLMQVSTSFYA
jgi:4-amino-4-deoxy-L-arabinose transferase-like glycosyltransferase